MPFRFTVRRLLGLEPPKLEEKPDIRWAITKPIPDHIVAGKGNAFYLAGWCYHPEHKLRNLEVMLDGRAQPVDAFRMPAPSVYRAHHPGLDPHGLSYYSGFWTVVNVPGYEESSTVTVQLKATLADGTWRLWTVGRVLVDPFIVAPFTMPAIITPESSDKPLIAICMTTYNPPLDLFSKQIESIKNQTYDNWVCIICDDHSRPDIFERVRASVEADPRFHVYRNRSNLGFYYNYERCLSLVPEAAEFVALCDHDDYWHPDKLETLLSQFDEETTLVYSDMNLVERSGKLNSKTYWTTRPNNYRNLASLLITNTITGAASLFRRWLLGYALPLPPQKVGSFHDHWIACVALATGQVKYVERPLYDYFQHSGNVVGHYAPPERRISRRLVVWFKSLSPRRVRERARSTLDYWRGQYYCNVLRIQANARILEARCGSFLRGAKGRAVRRIRDMDRSLYGLCWLAFRGISNAWRVSATLGAEYKLLRGLIWRRLFAPNHSRLPHGEPDLNEFSPFEGDSLPKHPDQALFAQQKTAPLALTLFSDASKRVNMLLPSIDFKYFFGGYITKLNLAKRLAENGFRVRLVSVDPPYDAENEQMNQIEQYEGLRGVFDVVEVVHAHDRKNPLEVSPGDCFIATTWWTAHIAHKATKEIGKDRFLYLIQEYEPFTFAMGAFAALAGQSYEFPHYAIFSTEFLREYFRRNSLGVYAEGQKAGDRNSIVFQNAITPVRPVTAEALSGRPCKRLLFYARPEPHNARNMFELWILALRLAVEGGYFDGEWEFYGIGSVDQWPRISLGQDRFLQMITRQSQQVYRDLLRCHDLGLSLMYTPHPSLVPIEMASAGMLVVTNTYANKTREALSEISSNIIAVEPSIEAVALGLGEAVARVNDYGERAQGSNVRWSTSWEQSFDPLFLSKISEFLGAVKSVVSF